MKKTFLVLIALFFISANAIALDRPSDTTKVMGVAYLALATVEWAQGSRPLWFSWGEKDTEYADRIILHFLIASVIPDRYRGYYLGVGMAGSVYRVESAKNEKRLDFPLYIKKW